MKTYKIRNVEKSVCCVEQKLAYNIAFRCNLGHDDTFKACETAMQKNELVFKLRDYYMRSMAENYNVKYDPDALFVALNQGLKAYMEHPFIATTYSEIGKAFPIPYAG